MDLYTINSIIKTLCYAEIFSYPLTFPEVSKYLISSKKISDRELLYTFSKYRNLFEEEKGFIVLKNSRKIIKTRLGRTSESRRKLAKALWISQILSHIPTIELIGISGSLSMYNAKKDDDIDLFFITSKNSLWVTRFLVVAVLFLLRQKRAVGKNIIKDKICPNMFITEDALSIVKKNRNLYSAHEVAQLKTVYEKNDMKNRFLHANAWVLKYMPHAFKLQNVTLKKSQKRHIINILDGILFVVQKYYMRRKITNEIIEKKRAFFHPIKMNEVVSQIYHLKVLHRRRMLEQIEITIPSFLRTN